VDQADKSEIINNILHSGEVLFRQLLPTVPKELLELDLSMTQLKVALLLFLNGPSRMSTLAAWLGVTLATATGVVDRLVERGVISRQSEPDDRRVVLCSLTKDGHKMVSTMWQSARNRTHQILDAMDVSKLRLLSEALQAMQEATISEETAANHT